MPINSGIHTKTTPSIVSFFQGITNKKICQLQASQLIPTIETPSSLHRKTTHQNSTTLKQAVQSVPSASAISSNALPSIQILSSEDIIAHCLMPRQLFPFLFKSTFQTHLYEAQIKYCTSRATPPLLIQQLSWLSC